MQSVWNGLTCRQFWKHRHVCNVLWQVFVTPSTVAMLARNCPAWPTYRTTWTCPPSLFYHIFSATSELLSVFLFLCLGFCCYNPKASCLPACPSVLLSMNSCLSVDFCDPLPTGEYLLVIVAPQWGAAGAEIKVPSDENTEVNGSPFKALSKSVYIHACYAYCQGFLPC